MQPDDEQQQQNATIIEYDGVHGERRRSTDDRPIPIQEQSNLVNAVVIKNVNQSSEIQGTFNQELNDTLRHQKLASDGMRNDGLADPNGWSRSQHNYVQSRDFFNAGSDVVQLANKGNNQQAPQIMLTSSQSHIVLSQVIRSPNSGREQEKDAPTQYVSDQQPIGVGSIGKESNFNPTSRNDFTPGYNEEQKDVSGERVTQYKEDSDVICQQVQRSGDSDDQRTTEKAMEIMPVKRTVWNAYSSEGNASQQTEINMFPRGIRLSDAAETQMPLRQQNTLAANQDMVIGVQTAEEDLDIDKSDLKSFKQVFSEKDNSVPENQSAQTPSLNVKNTKVPRKETPMKVEQYSASYQPSQMSIMSQDKGSQEKHSQKTGALIQLQKNFARENISQDQPVQQDFDVSMQNINQEIKTNSDQLDIQDKGSIVGSQTIRERTFEQRSHEEVQQQADQEIQPYINQMVNEQGGNKFQTQGSEQRSNEQLDRFSVGLREVDERGGSVQMSAVSGSYRSDIRDSQTSAVVSGSNPSKDVPLDYSITAGNNELKAQLLAAANADQQTGMDEGVKPIFEDEAEYNTQTPIQLSKKDVQPQKIQIINQAEDNEDLSNEQTEQQEGLNQEQDQQTEAEQEIQKQPDEIENKSEIKDPVLEAKQSVIESEGKELAMQTVIQDSTIENGAQETTIEKTLQRSVVEQKEMESKVETDQNNQYRNDIETIGQDTIQKAEDDFVDVDVPQLDQPNNDQNQNQVMADKSKENTTTFQFDNSFQAPANLRASQQLEVQETMFPDTTMPETATLPQSTMPNEQPSVTEKNIQPESEVQQSKDLKIGKKKTSIEKPYDPFGPEASSANIPFEPTVKGAVPDGELELENSVSEGIRDHINGPDSDDGLAENVKLDKLLHRLPNNYFIQDDDEQDINTVVNNIQNMRNQMYDYVQEKGIDKEMKHGVTDIADIIEPEKFIKKHYSNKLSKESSKKSDLKSNRKVNETEKMKESFSNPPKFLFEEVLKDSAVVTPKTLNEQERAEQMFEKQVSQATLEKQKELYQEQKAIRNSQRQSKKSIQIQNVESGCMPRVDFWGNDQANNQLAEQQLDQIVQDQSNELQAINETHDFSVSGIDNSSHVKNTLNAYQDNNEENMQQVESYMQQMNTDQQMNSPELQASMTNSFPWSQTGPRVMKMADYFHEGKSGMTGAQSDMLQTGNFSNQNTSFNQPSMFSNSAAAENALLASGPPVAIPLSEMDVPVGFPSTELQWANSLGKRVNSYVSRTDNTRKAYQQRLKQVEDEILRNVDINFLFTKGHKLHESLIDPRRVHQIVLKIKQLAREQIEKGSKDINYMELVEFLKSKDLGFVGPQTSNNDTFVEPQQTELEEFAQDQWQQVLSFMRNNPKLLMQMVPDGSDPSDMRQFVKNNSPYRNNPNYLGSTAIQQADAVLKRSKVYEKIQEAQRFQKLRQLSHSFNAKRKVNRSPNANKTYFTQQRQTSNDGFNSMGNSISKPPLAAEYKSVGQNEQLISIGTNGSNISRKTPILEPIPSARKMQKKKLPNIKIRDQALSKQLNDLDHVRVNQKQKARRIQGSALVTNQDANQRKSSVGKQSNNSYQERKIHRVDLPAMKPQDELSLHKKDSQENLQVQEVEVNTLKDDNKHMDNSMKSFQHMNQNNSFRGRHKDSRTDAKVSKSNFQHKSIHSNSSVARSQMKDDASKKDDSIHMPKPLPKFVDPNTHQYLQQRIKKQEAQDANRSGIGNSQFYKSQNQFASNIDGSRSEIVDNQGMSEPSYHHNMSQTNLRHERPRNQGRPVTATQNQSAYLSNGFPPSNSNLMPGIQHNSGRVGLQNLKSPQNANFGYNGNIDNEGMVASKQKYISSDNLFNGGLKSSKLQTNNQQRLWPSGILNGAPSVAPQSTKQAIRVASMRNKQAFGLPMVDNASYFNQGKSADINQVAYPPKFINPKSMRGYYAQKMLNVSSGTHSEFMKKAKPVTKSPNTKEIPAGFYQWQKSQERVKSKSRSKSRDNSYQGQVLRSGKASPQKNINKDVKMFGSFSNKQMAQRSPPKKIERSRSKSSKKIDRSRSNASKRKSKSNSEFQMTTPGKRSIKGGMSIISKSKSPPRILQDSCQMSPIPFPQNRRVDFGPGTEDSMSMKAQVSQGALKGKNERKGYPLNSSRKSNSGKRKRFEKGSNDATRGAQLCEVQTQTDLRGVEHKILVRAKQDELLSSEEVFSDMGQIKKDKSARIEIEDNRSRFEPDGTNSRYNETYTQYVGEHLPPRQKKPAQDNAELSLEQQFLLRGDHLVEPHSLYRANEIEIVLENIKSSYKDFKRTDIMKPFYLKALATLRKLLSHLGKEETYQRVCHEYKEVTLENTIKLLLRCRLAYGKIKNKKDQDSAIMEDDAIINLQTQ